MKGGAYYNEHDRKKAAWLRNLIEEGEIAPGVVDERSIAEVQPEDLAGFAQCHFFAGVGLWSLCLRRAGWPDDRPVWTGSCPCGPFSAAGLRTGFADPRHLWPEWFRLIRQCRPDRIFGEQSAEASEWLDLVSGDLEGDRYAIGSADIPAAGFGGAHRRQRFGFVADADNAEWWSERAPWHDGRWPTPGRLESNGHFGEHRRPIVLAHPNGDGPTSLGGDDGEVRGLPTAERQSEHRPLVLRGDGVSGGVAYADGWRARVVDGQPGGQYRQLTQDGGDADWLQCRDARWRPVESGTFPLAYEDPNRMGRLHAYGDAIDVEAFTALIAAYMDVAPAERLAA